MRQHRNGDSDGQDAIFLEKFHAENGCNSEWLKRGFYDKGRSLPMLFGTGWHTASFHGWYSLPHAGAGIGGDIGVEAASFHLKRIDSLVLRQPLLRFSRRLGRRWRDHFEQTRLDRQIDLIPADQVQLDL